MNEILHLCVRGGTVSTVASQRDAPGFEVWCFWLFLGKKNTLINIKETFLLLA